MTHYIICFIYVCEALIFSFILLAEQEIIFNFECLLEIINTSKLANVSL